MILLVSCWISTCSVSCYLFSKNCVCEIIYKYTEVLIALWRYELQAWKLTSTYCLCTSWVFADSSPKVHTIVNLLRPFKGDWFLLLHLFVEKYSFCWNFQRYILWNSKIRIYLLKFRYFWISVLCQYFSDSSLCKEWYINNSKFRYRKLGKLHAGIFKYFQLGNRSFTK